MSQSSREKTQKCKLGLLVEFCCSAMVYCCTGRVWNLHVPLFCGLSCVSSEALSESLVTSKGVARHRKVSRLVTPGFLCWTLPLVERWGESNPERDDRLLAARRKPFPRGENGVHGGQDSSWRVVAWWLCVSDLEGSQRNLRCCSLWLLM